MTICKKAENPPHQKWRFFIATKGVDLSLDIWPSRKAFKGILQNTYLMLSLVYFFSIWLFFLKHSPITGLQGKGEGVSVIPHYHFHQLHIHLDISWVITAESSPLHIASSRTRTRNLFLYHKHNLLITTPVDSSIF